MWSGAEISHEIPGRPPLQLESGDIVEVGERATCWPEFVYVTCAAGSGWVPARHLSTDSGPATVVDGYDATELAVDTGEQVEALERDELSGCWWCRSVAGSAGWVPQEVFPRQRL